jgi:hypothetical protein
MTGWGPRAIGFLLLVAAAVSLAALPASTQGTQGTEDGRTPLPHPSTAFKGEQCVEPVAVMRRQHMNFLLHQRDETVRDGIRGKKYSLRGCIDCHATPDDSSHGARTVQGFCDACHDYASVEITCFECHSDRAER